MTPEQQRALARQFRMLARLAGVAADLAEEGESLAGMREGAHAVARHANGVVEMIDMAEAAAALLDRVDHARAQQAAPNVVRLPGRVRR